VDLMQLFLRWDSLTETEYIYRMYPTHVPQAIYLISPPSPSRLSEHMEGCGWRIMPCRVRGCIEKVLQQARERSKSHYLSPYIVKSRLSMQFWVRLLSNYLITHLLCIRQDMESHVSGCEWRTTQCVHEGSLEVTSTPLQRNVTPTSLQRPACNPTPRPRSIRTTGSPISRGRRAGSGHCRCY